MSTDPQPADSSPQPSGFGRVITRGLFGRSPSSADQEAAAASKAQSERGHTDTSTAAPQHRSQAPHEAGEAHVREKPPGKRVGVPSGQVAQKQDGSKLEEMKEAFAQLELDHAAMADQLGRRENYIRVQQERLREQNKKIEVLRDSVGSLQQRQKQLEGIVIERQEDALRSVAGSKYTPKEDKVIRDEIDKLGAKIRLWARSTCTAGLDSIAPSEGSLVIKHLGRYCAYQDWQEMVKDLPIQAGKIPAILLQALLARDIFGTMFTDPFFAWIPTEDGESTQGPQQMKMLYRAMADTDTSQAHIWRSQTLRNLLQTPDSGDESFLDKRTKRIGPQLAAHFLQGPARTLMQSTKGSDDGVSAQRKQELQSLYIQAGRLALSLWTQRAYMRCLDLRDLPLFSVANPVMSVHRLQQLDEDDTRLDGGKLVLLVQPVILAFGSENAEHYDRHKQWAPAVALVSSPPSVK
ncbi:hypothetical protein BDV18DRAFT_160119 [Aspergillus unguis]